MSGIFSSATVTKRATYKCRICKQPKKGHKCMGRATAKIINDVELVVKDEIEPIIEIDSEPIIITSDSDFWSTESTEVPDDDSLRDDDSIDKDVKPAIISRCVQKRVQNSLAWWLYNRWDLKVSLKVCQEAAARGMEVLK